MCAAHYNIFALMRWTMKYIRINKLYMRIFIVTGSIALLFQFLFTMFFSAFFAENYKRQSLLLTRNVLTSTVQSLESTMNRLELTVYSLGYCDLMQEALNLTARDSSYDILRAQADANSLMFIMQMLNPTHVEFIVFSNGAVPGIYSTINSSYTDKSYDFANSDWFCDFISDPDNKKAFYPNVSMSGYIKQSYDTVNIMAFRLNNVYSRATNGYVFLQFDELSFAEWMGDVRNIADNILIVDQYGETLYDTLSFVDKDTLCDEAQYESGSIHTAANGVSYLPLYSTSSELGWTIYCTVDATSMTTGLRRLQVMFYLLYAISSICLLSAVYWACKHITRPLALMARSMEAVHGRNFSQRLPVHGHDEIASLTTAFNGMMQQLEDANRRVKEYRLLQQSTAFYALQQQINPHFLYNTLDMIIGMATQCDMEQIISACSCLGSMFRYNLARELTVPLGSELKHIQNYIRIMSMRSRGRIQIVLNVPQSEHQTMIPKLTLQPFIENSVKYSFDDMASECVIELNVERKAELLTVSIADNGAGFSNRILDELGSVVQHPESADVDARHIGILNVCRRLHLIYGEGFSMELKNRPTGGALVTLSFPPDYPKTVI